MFLLNPAIRTAVAAAIVAVLVFYFPKFPKDQAHSGLELLLAALAGWLTRSPGDGMAKMLTEVKPVEPPKGPVGSGPR